MVKFLDGPAAGVTLALRRAPIMLRVVFNPRRHADNTWDALDQPADAPRPHESVYVYRMIGNASSYHLCIRGKGKAAAGFYMSAEYKLFDPPPPQESIRDNAQWESFCARVKDRVLHQRELEKQFRGSEATS